MEINLSFEYIRPEHGEIISNFQCSDEPTVATFLKERALYLHQADVAKTRLYFDEDQNLVGYFTLFNDSVEIGKRNIGLNKWNHLPDKTNFPAVALHYLGVDDRHRGKHYGQYILYETFDVCNDIREMSGCNFISLQALQSSIGFYRKYGFVGIGFSNGEFIPMVLNVDRIKQ